MAKIKYQGRKGNRVTSGQIARAKQKKEDKEAIKSSMKKTSRGMRPTEKTKEIKQKIKDRDKKPVATIKKKTARGTRTVMSKADPRVAEAMKPLAEAAKNKTLVGGTKPTGTMAKLLEAMSQSDKKKKKKKSSGLRAVRRMMSSRYQR